MNPEELFEFCKEWLSAWTGNRPEKLLDYYTADALYIDPQHRDGLRGHDEIRGYFEKLLDVYHDWEWKPLEVFPIDSGAIVKWEATIHVGQETLTEVGLDIVEIEGKKIRRNEVYFDRTRLLAAVDKLRKTRRVSQW
ncbi:MAG: nuclear transport factor 2 family protein [Promethearchaeota archaeon]